MVSDQEIAQALDSLLRETNPTTTTLTGVVQQLESKLGLALTHKLDFIRNQIHLLLRSPPPQLPHFHHYQPTPKDHFFLQQNPNFHANLPPNFTLHQHADGLGFLSQKPPPVTKTESFVTDADTSSAAITAPQLPPNFTLHQHADELGFLSQKPPPVTKTESFVTDADTSSAAINASQLPPNFALHQHADELGFRSQKPPSVTKTESFVTDADTSAAAESPKTSSQTGKKRRGGPGGLNKICEVSPELQAIVGHPALARTEIVKQLWAYIRKHNLQDPSNKRKIICNDELRLVFETDCTDMFKMNKLLSKHIISLEPPKPVRQKSKKAKVEVEPVTQSAESGPVVVISEALAIFFGIAGREMLQSEVLRRVWEYVKVNQLEDPINAMVILCDSKLQELFGCASISALGISEMLARHHLFQR